MKFDAAGKPAGSYDFGWDYTPAVWQHDGTYSIVVKDNHYDFDPVNMVDLGPYYITQLDANLKVEWQLPNTNTQELQLRLAPHAALHRRSSRTASSGASTRRPSTPTAPSTPAAKTACSTPSARAASTRGTCSCRCRSARRYTPLSIDHKGRIYQQNDGILERRRQLISQAPARYAEA